MGLKFFNDNASHDSLLSVKRVLAVASGKGGVGKSSVTVHLARSLSSLGLKVGIFDADIYGPSMQRMVKVLRPPLFDDEIEKVRPATDGELKVMSKGFFSKNQESVIRSPIANRIIQQFVEEVEGGLPQEEYGRTVRNYP